MPTPDFKSKPGNAPVKQVGHTAGNRFGTDSTAQVKGSRTSRDLNVK